MADSEVRQKELMTLELKAMIRNIETFRTSLPDKLRMMQRFYDAVFSAGMRAGEIARSERPKLCYVEADVAYFTTQELDKQWGDDWNDAPYEHNAGTPYGPYRPGDNWTITEIRFAGDFQVPCDGHCNSPWSVEQINRGFCPWLRTHQHCIMAGATVEEFCKFITEKAGLWRFPPRQRRRNRERNVD